MKINLGGASVQFIFGDIIAKGSNRVQSVLCWLFLLCAGLFFSGCADTEAARNDAMKVTTTSDAANNWLRVQVEPTLAPDVVWQKLVDSVTGSYPSLEMVDATSGYMRSVYNIRQFGVPGSGIEFTVRTRFICSISSKSPLVYKMKIESECKAPNEQDWALYNRVFKQDAQLIEELQSRLGVK